MQKRLLATILLTLKLVVQLVRTESSYLLINRQVGMLRIRLLIAFSVVDNAFRFFKEPHVFLSKTNSSVQKLNYCHR